MIGSHNRWHHRQGITEVAEKGGGVLTEFGGRPDKRCVSRSAVVSGKARQRQGPHQRSEVTPYYLFLCPPRTGGGHAPAGAETNEKMVVGSNSEEAKWR